MSFLSDFKLAKERDPAARSSIEIFLTTPGLHAIWLHRLAHFLWRMHIPLLPRLVSQLNRFLTGIEIHPGAHIGRKFFIDHGLGVVIGETTEIGDNVTLFQGVTLGGTGKEKGKRHPTIGDNVVLAAGAKVLGNITIGDNSRVGAGSVVIKTVPSNSMVAGVPGRFEVHRGQKIDTSDLHHEQLPDPVAEMFRHIERRIDTLDHNVYKAERGE